MSFVRLITADGGKREEGVEKENRARSFDDRDAKLALMDSAGLDLAEMSEMNVRKVGTAMKQKSRMTSLEGLMKGNKGPA